MKSTAIFNMDMAGSKVDALMNAKGIVQSTVSGAMNADFSSMMEQTQTGLMAKISKLQGTASSDDYEPVNTIQTAYDKQTSSNTASKQIADVEHTEQTISAEEKKAVDDAVEEVKETIKDTYGITDEELTAAMEALGLTDAQLLMTNHLNALVGEITQTSNPFEVLTTDEFAQLSQKVADICSTLEEQLDVSISTVTEQITAGLDAAGQQNEMSASMQEMLGMMEMVTAEEMSDISQAIAAGETQTVSMPETTVDEASVQNAVTVSDTKANKAEIVVEETITPNAAEAEERIAVVQTTDASMNTEENASQEESMSETFHNEKEAFAESHENAEPNPEVERVTFSDKTVNPTVTTNTVTTLNADGTQTIIQTQTTSYTGNVDIQSLMTQITREAAIRITDTESSMTMQLNPENLGKLTLQVVAKGSAVTAQIIAENEAVKQALEANVANLRENLNNNGLKVEAVEVTVSTHEFEKNLEQGTGNGEQMNDEQNRQTASEGRRNLNMNELDELSGMLTEEEMLAAQMMADNGNTMDVTA